MRNSKHIVFVGIVGILAFLGALSVSEAGPVVPVGSDFLETLSGTTFDPDGPGGALPIPFKGVPLPGHGGASTEVRRLQEANAPLETIPIELAQLQLMSVQPVEGQPLFVTLQSARGGPRSLGQMTIDFDPNHHVFTSFFDVFFDIRVGGLDGAIIESNSARLTLDPPEVQWCQPGFIPGCGDPFTERHPFIIHRVKVPQPNSLALLGIGIASVAAGCSRWLLRRSA